ncbi:MAG: thiaminase II, partial [Sphingobacteriaceae bacterium]
MKWTQEAWQRIGPLYQQILDMPFIEHLSDGTLPKEKFQFYMLQDAMYLA